MQEQSNMPRQTLPLNMATPGETVELIEIRGGRRLRKRLADLGLSIGISLRIVQGDPAPPVHGAVAKDGNALETRVGRRTGQAAAIIEGPVRRDGYVCQAGAGLGTVDPASLVP